MAVLVVAVNRIGQFGFLFLVHQRNPGDFAHVDLHRVVFAAGDDFGIQRNLAGGILFVLRPGTGGGGLAGLAAAGTRCGLFALGLRISGGVVDVVERNRSRFGLRREFGRRSFHFLDHQLAPGFQSGQRFRRRAVILIIGIGIETGGFRKRHGGKCGGFFFLIGRSGFFRDIGCRGAGRRPGGSGFGGGFLFCHERLLSRQGGPQQKKGASAPGNGIFYYNYKKNRKNIGFGASKIAREGL